uniref:Conotoxin pc6b n=1 Tax=Conus pictus TaxID=1042615 RepID=O16B_CONPB|nr:RecName: Full=Conotoxin pc6b [Conus pictus]
TCLEIGEFCGKPMMVGSLCCSPGWCFFICVG